MKIKFGLKKYDIYEVKNIKDKLRRDTKKILYYPNTSWITTFLGKDGYDIIVTDKFYQVISLYRDVKKNKIFCTKGKTHIFLFPKNMSQKIVIGSVLKIIY